MMQLSTPLSRTTDPQTSHDAADKSRVFKARHIAIIWDALKTLDMIKPGIATPRAIAEYTGIDYVAVQRRGAEMERKGLIVRGPDKRHGQLVWREKC